MKIKRIVLNNIGPYVGINDFDISIDHDRNVVLIGGKNGAGKTTFFKAIKTCLYGCKVWGYEAPGKAYYSFIKTLINSHLHLQSDTYAFVEMDLIFDDGKQKNIYTLTREWTISNQNISEDFIINKNNIRLEDGEKEDFVNYLLSIIPPDMFNFYFFDGESIADFFLGGDGDKNFRNAFLKLYNLDTLSLIIENFERTLRKKDVKNQPMMDYLESKKKHQESIQKLDELALRKNEIESSIELCNVKLLSLKNEYKKAGGISINDWKALNTELTLEESKREEKNRCLKEFANNSLPFYLIRDSLERLLDSLYIEQKNQNNIIIKKYLSSLEFENILNSYFDTQKQKFSFENFINYLQREIVIDGKERYFDFSLNSTARMIEQIKEKLSFDAKLVEKTLKEITKSLNTSKKIREKITSSSIDNFEEYSQKVAEIEKDINSYQIVLEKVITNIEISKNDAVITESQFTKAKEAYEKMLKARSVTDMSARAITVYTKLEEDLIKMQSKMLEKEFIKCFSSIINKSNFLDGVILDEKISVIPYKYIHITKSEIDNYMKVVKDRDFLSLFDKNYVDQINDLRIGKVDKVKLPTPISAPFSQGERQVYIMSLYLALLKTSNKSIPFFIDTPFARVDSKHRDNIVKKFFNVIDNQLFILSTDEVISGEFEEMIDNKVSNKFLLNSDNYGVTNVLPNKYFGGKL